MTPLPTAFGLYDPSHEHDACGVGFVAHIKGQKSRDIVQRALSLLIRMRHRGATGRDPLTGDGAGILLQLPHRFYKRVGAEEGFEMPRRRGYGVGMVFLPQDPVARAACERVLEETVRAEGQHLLGWRDVPVCPEAIGPLARASIPVIRQIFIARRRLVPSAFERKLFVIRKLAENRVRSEALDPEGMFHLPSLSAETIIYKGMLLPEQLEAFYPDLSDSGMVSGLALVHSRFSTNTLPSWPMAQPFRHVAHNGEINTVRGNRNWMNARRSLLASGKFGGPLDRLYPVVVPGTSDSSQFDNMLELLHLGGRSLPHAMMMLIPEAWEQHEQMDPARHAFYEYSSSLMEPWDGPAVVAFTDGSLIGATLDRNGLRPARWLITEDDLVVLASETGVVDIHPAMIRQKGRLQPGRMFLVDTDEGVIVKDDAIKAEITQRWPYAKWLRKNRFELAELPPGRPPQRLEGDTSRVLMRAMGYTDEDLIMLVRPMATEGKEPIGSMGNDTPLAALSTHAPSLFDYFHQQFAQVTNPAIDPIRESMVMSLDTDIGQDGNTFEETPDQCHQLNAPGPVLTNEELARIKDLRVGVFEPVTLSTLYRMADGPQALAAAVDRLCAVAAESVERGQNVLILSDRGVDARHGAIPALLALSAVHQHLIREGIRLQTGLVVETAETREVHHFAALLGFGAAAINPYLVLDYLNERARDGHRPQFDFDGVEVVRRYIQAVDKGLLKVMSKMGISTLASYRGAQIFEAIGLDPALIDRHFTGTNARLGGVGLEALGREVQQRHNRAYGERARFELEALPLGGRYRWRRNGEHHQWNPRSVALLQDAARRNDPATFAAFEAAVDGDGTEAHVLRDLLAPIAGEPIALSEVESAADLARRFVSGAMSFGSISAEAHETMAIAMNRLGARSNSGEGGEETRRNIPDANGDSRRSAIKQIASGRFGVTVEYLVNADDLQIKVSQGAKPGEGGQLPGHKVDARIAKVRCATPGVTLISPPPHHDIYSIEDLKQLIYDLRTVNPQARISVKLVAEAGVGTVAAGVAKAGADAIVIAGWSGGTGASPLSSLKHAGVPWELGLAEAQQVLVLNGLRQDVRLQVDGGLRTSRDLLVATLLGAEEWGLATAALVVEGCILLRKCHKNTCAVGIATQNPELRKRFAGQADHIVNYLLLLAGALRRRMAALGFRRLDDLVGRVDRLEIQARDPHWKIQQLDVTALLATAPGASETPRHCLGFRDQDDGDHLDHGLIKEAARALTGAGPVRLQRTIQNTDRAVGTRLSGHIARQFGGSGLPRGTIYVDIKGSAGQSFGAWLAPGVTLDLRGDTNDYLGKGLSGGRIIVAPPKGVRFAPEDNILIGNTALYGATSGDAYINGLAGERFAVRNSGAKAVVEGVGDHGCEYMTGGVVVVLGATGRNFAAGMSGGVAFVFDRDQTLRKRCNLAQVELESLVDESDIWLLHTLISDHVRHTSSPLGQRILDHWALMVGRFVKVMPTEYKRVLQAQRAQRMAGTQTPGTTTPGSKAVH
jgi:glutamate synthase (NADPH/NADH) large chain